MNRIRVFAMAAMFMFALNMAAQQPAASPDDSAVATKIEVPGVEQHLKVLTEKLDLTSDQQARTTPVLQELHYASQKLAEDESMSRGERIDNLRAPRYKADRKIREILNDDQKKKLDQLEEQPHSGLHGDANAAGQ
jgi:Spy/CpxP family protein refolding chaperone